ncbi:C39 family peptidase [Ruminococcus flavefaciens]|uniref:C39 family peptidase n=1 Tax=Ruminococcus flavefaciens TaxID=1265 RepID=UPI0004AE81FA|nr:C39 family peptidase [Ruminococcus flavefaciens]
MKVGFSAVAAVLAAVSLTLASCGQMTQLAHDNSLEFSKKAEDRTNDREKIVRYQNDQVFSLDISIKEGEAFPNKYENPGYKALMQNPELPTGCEVTSLCSLLNYLGFDIDKETLADEFMPMDNVGVSTMMHAYIGDPKSEEGFGCSAPVIVQTADDYFESILSPCYAVNMTGRSLKELLYQVAQGRPVIVWSTIDLMVMPTEYYWDTIDGEEMWFNGLQHCMVIYGYDLDERTLSVADPLAGNVKYEMEKFNEVYQLMGNQAVLICGNSETKGKFVVREREKSPILSRNAAQRKADEEEAARRMAEEEARRKAEEEAKRIAEAESVAEPAPDEQVPEEAEQSPQPDEEEIPAEEEQE